MHSLNEILQCIKNTPKHEIIDIEGKEYYVLDVSHLPKQDINDVVMYLDSLDNQYHDKGNDDISSYNPFS